MAVIRPLKVFTEDVDRRFVQTFGQVQSMSQVWTGPISGFPKFNPQLGSVAQSSGFPLFYLQGINKKIIPGSNYELTLNYLGTDQQSANFSDLRITTDLLTKSFSWSGVAKLPVDITGLPPGTFLANVSIEIQYQTVEVTFTYTAYKYLNGALFQGLAPNYGQILNVYMQSTVGTGVALGAYTGVPTIISPIKPLVQLTRYSCDQMTPTQETNSGVNWVPDTTGTPGIWRCQETWGLNYNLGSLGFNIQSYVSTTP